VELPQAYGEEHEVNENEGSHETLIGIALLVGLVLIAVFLVVSAGVRWYLSPENQLSIVERRDLVQGLTSAGQALAVALTGAVGLGGLFFTWRNTNQARESTQRTLELTEQGQITERFTKAIEQLGASNAAGDKILEMRLGGIYALERISKASKDDYETIMETLSAYVRHHAPYAPEANSNGSGTSQGPDNEDEVNEDMIYSPTFQHKDADIQAILNVFGRRIPEWPNDENVRINLQDTDLSGFATTRRAANFTGVWFFGSKLRHAKFIDANLRDARFRRADLSFAIFQGTVNFEGTNFKETTLDKALFNGVDLTQAKDLTQAQIDQASGFKNSRLPDGLYYPEHWRDSTEQDT
jgi:hypothetical protein